MITTRINIDRTICLDTLSYETLHKIFRSDCYSIKQEEMFQHIVPNYFVIYIEMN